MRPFFAAAAGIAASATAADGEVRCRIRAETCDFSFGPKAFDLAETDLAAAVNAAIAATLETRARETAALFDKLEADDHDR
jgi:hypothetical protein